MVGLDSSAKMISAARADFPQLEFLLSDARDFALPYTLDAVLSNATLHWIPEAESVVQCIAKPLKTGGRFVTEFGGKDNIAQIVAALAAALKEFGHSLRCREVVQPIC
ncbi:MAG: methyltransferase domain-containing protein [Pyrinomonadaceae bacterium]